MEWLRKTGIRVDEWIQRKLTPAGERHSVERDLVQQRIADTDPATNTSETPSATQEYPLVGFDPSDTLERMVIHNALNPSSKIAKDDL